MLASAFIVGVGRWEGALGEEGPPCSGGQAGLAGAGTGVPFVVPQKGQRKRNKHCSFFLLPSLLQLGFLSKSTSGAQNLTVSSWVQKSVISNYQTKLKTR